MSKIPSSIIGACGEHYVSALLSSLGLVVALPRAGVPSTDLIVTNESSERAVSIQVKTGTNPLNEYKRKSEKNYYAWDTSEKVINLTSPSLWYAYVNLNGWPLTPGKSPEVFFVTSAKVSKVVADEKKSGASRLFFWLNTKEAENYAGANGAQELIKYIENNKISV